MGLECANVGESNTQRTAIEPEGHLQHTFQLNLLLKCFANRGYTLVLILAGHRS